MALFIFPMIQPSYKEFCRLAKDGNLIPVYQELLMDLETPCPFSNAWSAIGMLFCLKVSKAASAGRAIHFWELGHTVFSSPAASTWKSSSTAK
jgi:hypothetical protein